MTFHRGRKGTFNSFSKTYFGVIIMHYITFGEVDTPFSNLLTRANHNLPTNHKTKVGSFFLKNHLTQSIGFPNLSGKS